MGEVISRLDRMENSLADIVKASPRSVDVAVKIELS